MKYQSAGCILVTGGTGFLGSYIIKELIEKGYSVRAIRRATSQLPFYIPQGIFDKVEWVEGDILDVVSLENAMEGAAIVIHAAAVVSFIPKERKRMYQVNVDGTANVVNVALEKKIKRLIHISSIAAIGRSADGGHVDEEKKWEENKSTTHYAKSKYRGELEVWRGMGEDLNAVILNPSTIIGYGDWNNSSCAIFKKIYEESKWYSPGINGFVDVEDTARAVVKIMESDIAEQRFIITNENMPFQQLLNMMSDNFHKKRPSKQITPIMLSIAWRMEAFISFIRGKKPILTKESARVAHSKTYFSNEKILKALPGFTFTPIGESIQKACEKYLANAGKQR
jgi:nucleoside-diphosphate-sugar epimerase